MKDKAQLYSKKVIQNFLPPINNKKREEINRRILELKIKEIPKMMLTDIKNLE